MMARYLIPSLALAGVAFGLPWVTHFADHGLSITAHLAWLGLLVLALFELRWRGLRLLIGAPLALYWPVLVLIFLNSDSVYFGF